jgi:hypothetical protein
MVAYLRTIAIGVDVTFNAVLGGSAYETLSARIGKSILSGGWASKINFPDWLHRHFIEAIFDTDFN